MARHDADFGPDSIRPPRGLATGGGNPLRKGSAVDGPFDRPLQLPYGLRFPTVHAGKGLPDCEFNGVAHEMH